MYLDFGLYYSDILLLTENYRLSKHTLETLFIRNFFLFFEVGILPKKFVSDIILSNA